uniref:Mobile element protein n=1 Tax=Klebsiella pneumoniae TaxID=573 RepID=A0A6G9HMP0_KLEPN|nr:Mobile element protein [Klebsiella pneumoniae]
MESLPTFAELKDQITYLPDNADRSVAKQKFKITNWPTYFSWH